MLLMTKLLATRVHQTQMMLRVTKVLARVATRGHKMFSPFCPEVAVCDKDVASRTTLFSLTGCTGRKLPPEIFQLQRLACERERERREAPTQQHLSRIIIVQLQQLACEREEKHPPNICPLFPRKVRNGVSWAREQ